MELIMLMLGFATACVAFLTALVGLAGTMVRTVAEIRGRSDADSERRQL